MTRLAAILALTLAMPAAAQEAVEDGALGWAMLPALEGLDRDGDGLFSQEEIGGTRVPPAFDMNGDGLFSVVELSQNLWAVWDRDDSGYLEADEKRAMTGFAAAGLYAYPGM